MLMIINVNVFFIHFYPISGKIVFSLFCTYIYIFIMAALSVVITLWTNIG